MRVFRSSLCVVLVLAAALLCALPLSAQVASEQKPEEASTAPAAHLRMGAGDEIDVTVFGVPELTQHLRIGSAGEITLPLLGVVRIGGLTAEEAQALIEKKLVDGGFLKNPHVSVFVKDYTSQGGITILGEVRNPGTYSPLKTQHLFDLFTAAGGLTEKAGNRVTIARRASPDPITILLSDDPQQSVMNNIELMPGDTVAVGKAGIVYVLGEVNRPGGFVLTGTSDGITVTQALARADGPSRLASLSGARILRRTSTGLETVDLDLKKILQAKSPDQPLRAEDIVFVPASKGKMAAEKGAGSILNMLTSLAIYRF